GFIDGLWIEVGSGADCGFLYVVETVTEKLIMETKRANDMTDQIVLRKADSAALWCFIATESQSPASGYKPWSYLLVPETAVLENATVAGLAST
ncbi:hypothetical protein, partial [Rhizobium leguminosarum]|uniref:hypothetical protein n=1 Tax=Rhizobium leguminosarum TaxID=384 RepID=UPI003F9E0978